MPLLHFNLLPSVLLLALPAADKVNSDVPGILRRSLLPTLAALLAAGTATGFSFSPHTSLPVMLACLPMLLLHTMLVSLGRKQLLHKVIRKNQALTHLGSTDMVTGLFLRRHWEQASTGVLREVHAGQHGAVLALIDVDGFKHANDSHGHVAGDALRRASQKARCGQSRPVAMHSVHRSGPASCSTRTAAMARAPKAMPPMRKG